MKFIEKFIVIEWQIYDILPGSQKWKFKRWLKLVQQNAQLLIEIYLIIVTLLQEGVIYVAFNHFF